MQLRNARLCLDCEELHQEPQCPACASESFAYLGRWLQAKEQPRSARPRGRADSQKTPRNKTWLASGLASVALIAAGRWLFQKERDDRESSDPDPHHRR